MVTLAILGLGSRGAETYGKYAAKAGSGFKITAVCDIDKYKLDKYGGEFLIESSMRFNGADDLFRRGKLADVLLIATRDRDHYSQAVTAMEKGYDLILEKPISVDLAECIEIRDKAAGLGRKVVVCHVLRYTAYYQKLKEIIDGGALGEIVAVTQEENVANWHYLHSFVRGAFANSRESSPMLLQKCCHDMDIMVFLTGQKAKSISSIGGLRHFKRENAPAGSADRCIDCKVKDCPYNAVDFYISNFRTVPESERSSYWPYFQLCDNPTEERLLDALRTGPHGRCAYRCGNDVVDHQFASVEFEGGIKGTLAMLGFANNGGRRTHVYGTKGECILDEQKAEIEIGIFTKKNEIIRFGSLTDDFSGHGGGDKRMMKSIAEYFSAGGGISVSLEDLLESHIMCFAAEESRLNGGKAVNKGDFLKKPCAKRNMGI